jgi:drug/metabolite transporter (DMT)-like permease
MFYFYTILVPVIIALILWFILKPKKIINFSLLLIFVLFVYSGVMYFLEMENIVKEGWIFYSLIFFLIPVLAITLIIKLILVLKKK